MRKEFVITALAAAVAMYIPLGASAADLSKDKSDQMKNEKTEKSSTEKTTTEKSTTDEGMKSDTDKTEAKHDQLPPPPPCEEVKKAHHHKKAVKHTHDQSSDHE